jgi:hypothetical protein
LHQVCPHCKTDWRVTKLKNEEVAKQENKDTKKKISRLTFQIRKEIAMTPKKLIEVEEPFELRERIKQMVKVKVKQNMEEKLKEATPAQIGVADLHAMGEIQQERRTKINRMIKNTKKKRLMLSKKKQAAKQATKGTPGKPPPKPAVQKK